jgi:hypothetical protein
MSAPNYKDPKSRLKLQLRLRPMRGSSAAAGLATGLSVLATIVCLIAFLASVLPGVEGTGSPFWFLAGAAAFALSAGVFHAAQRFFRRFR